MAALAANKTTARGERIKLNDNTPITATGTIDFDVPGAGGSGGDFSALFQAVGTVTALVCDLQVSLDGGVTFNTLVANLLVAATPFKLQTPIIAGARYRLNITGAPTSSDFYVTTN